LRLAHDEIKRLVEFQLQIRESLGAKPTMDYPKWGSPPRSRRRSTRRSPEGHRGRRNADKATREAQIGALKQEVAGQLAERFPTGGAEIGRAFDAEIKKAVRAAILTEGIRPDGRRTDEIRKIWCKVGVLPRTHGSALFTA